MASPIRHRTWVWVNSGVSDGQEAQYAVIHGVSNSLDMTDWTELNKIYSIYIYFLLLVDCLFTFCWWFLFCCASFSKLTYFHLMSVLLISGVMTPVNNNYILILHINHQLRPPAFVIVSVLSLPVCVRDC